MNEILPLAIGIGAIGSNITVLLGVLFNPGGLILRDDPIILIIEAFFFFSLAAYLFARLLTKMYSNKNGPKSDNVRKKPRKSNQDGKGQRSPED